MAFTPTGGGYYEVAADGGIFAFGNAPFYGSMGAQPLAAPIVGMAVTPTGGGYDEVAADGGIFAFGTAPFHGSASGMTSASVVAGAMAPTGKGYYEAGADGGVFAFGGVPFDGSGIGQSAGSPVVAMATDPDGGYWEASRSGGIYAFGSPYEGSLVSPTPDPTPDPSAVNGSQIAGIALSQVGSSDGYLYGPNGSTWCGYFTSWVWGQAGIPIGPTGEAVGIGQWALDNGGTLLPPTATPQVGDAVLWEWGGSGDAWPDPSGLNYGNILHVNIVVSVLPGDQIVTVGGNESGAVRQLGPFSVQGAGFTGQSIYAFVQPPA
jgi:hypothetical protein